MDEQQVLQMAYEEAGGKMPSMKEREKIALQLGCHVNKVAERFKYMLKRTKAGKGGGDCFKHHPFSASYKPAGTILGNLQPLPSVRLVESNDMALGVEIIGNPAPSTSGLQNTETTAPFSLGDVGKEEGEIVDNLMAQFTQN
ncbi:hypothetical protein FRC11_000491, partial [Ceratobasidium sp. 423]